MEIEWKSQEFNCQVVHTDTKEGAKMDNIMAVISLLIAIVGIFLTMWQIRLSNRQALLDKRLDLYIKARGMYTLWKKIVT